MGVWAELLFGEGLWLGVFLVFVLYLVAVKLMGNMFYPSVVLLFVGFAYIANVGVASFDMWGGIVLSIVSMVGLFRGR